MRVQAFFLSGWHGFRPVGENFLVIEGSVRRPLGEQLDAAEDDEHDQDPQTERGEHENKPHMKEARAFRAHCRGPGERF